MAFSCRSDLTESWHSMASLSMDSHSLSISKVASPSMVSSMASSMVVSMARWCGETFGFGFFVLVYLSEIINIKYIMVINTFK